MKIAITKHAHQRIRERVKRSDPFKLAYEAWDNAEKLNDREVAKLHREYQPDIIYIKYQGFIFVYQLKKDIVLITVIKSK